MKKSVNSLSHVLSILVILSASHFLTNSILSVTTQNVHLIELYLWYIPVSLLLQTILLAVSQRLSDQKFNYIPADTISVIFLELLINCSLLFSHLTNLTDITGPLVIIILLIRTFVSFRYLIKQLSSCSLRNRAALFAFAIVVLLLPLTQWRTISKSMEGDEPYYLLLCYSIIHDHDINLENNFLQNDSLTFINRKLVPQQFDNYIDGKLVSRHSPLMALILLPGFYFAGITGVLLTLLLLTGLLAAALIVVTAQLDLPPDLSIPVILLLILTAPVLFYSTSVFAEIPAALLGVLSLSLGLKISTKKSVPVFWVCLTIVFAIVLKTRLALLCIPPIIAGYFSRIRIQRDLIKVIAMILILLIAIGIVNTLIFGSPFIRYSVSILQGLTFVRLFRGVTGLLWDQQWGLFPLNPMMLLAIPGIYLFRKNTSLSNFIIWCFSIVPYFILIAALAELSGGICPRGRFLVAWLPLLTIPLIYLVQSVGTGILSGLAGCSIVISCVLISKPNWQIVFPGSTDYIPAKLSLLFNSDFMHILPLFDRVDPSLFRIGCGLLIFTLIVFSLPALIGKKILKTRITYSIVTIFACVIAVFSLGTTWQTSWMDTEDPSFNKSDHVINFWEETKSWEYQTPSDSPYRSGLRLLSGGKISRSIPLRPPSENPEMHLAIEIEARGSLPCSSIPAMQISAGGKILRKIRIESTNFQKYYCPWPFGIENTPELIIESIIPPDDNSWVDINRIRLIPWNSPWPLNVSSYSDTLPVSLGSLTLNEFSYPDHPVKQAEHFTVKLSYEIIKNRSDIEYSLLFKTGTRTYFHKLDSIATEGYSQETVLISPESGAGIFDILLQARDKSGELLKPKGEHSYLVGKRAWLGKIEIEPAMIPSESSFEKIILSKIGLQQEDLFFLPYAFHIAGNTNLTYKFDKPVKSNNLLLISHIADVFEEIPFETKIADLCIVTNSDTKVLPIIIGRHTAEAMYEFSGKDIKISHTHPEIVYSSPGSVKWPYQLENMDYNVLYFWTEFPLDLMEEIETISIKTYNFPGVFDIYSTALVLAP